MPVSGYDLVDTEITFVTGAQAHILTGWAVPNTAWSTTVQSGRLICSEGLLDLGLDAPGLHEIHPEGVIQVNPLFRNFERTGQVTGYGITSPGRLYQQILAFRNGTLAPKEYAAAMSPMALGFYTTLVLEAAEHSLRTGHRNSEGTTIGDPVDLRELVSQELGPGAKSDYAL